MMRKESQAETADVHEARRLFLFSAISYQLSASSYQPQTVSRRLSL
jgi:hypothetical protein